MVFVTDHVFYSYNKGIYSNKFSLETLNRYTNVFGKITIIARVKDVSNIDGVGLCSRANIKFEFMNSISSLKSFFGERKIVRNQIKNIILKHDSVISRVPSQLGYVAAELAEKNNIKFGLEVVGCTWEAHFYHSSLVAKIYSFYAYFKMKSIVNSSFYSLYVTDNFLQRRYPAKTNAKVTNVSNVELLNSDEELLQSRIKRINKKNKTTVYGSIGSLATNYKGIHLAIKALSLCSFDYEYRILGEGVYVNKYKKLAKDLNISKKIKFEGIIGEREKLFNWIDDLDVYLQPSLTEGLPRTLIEAMSRACPSIGSNSGGIPELLKKEVIFKSKDYKALKSIILKLVNNTHLLELHANENFKKAKEFRKETLDYRRSQFWSDFNNS
ncbi:glycosyltransferase [Flavobacteriaceae bacterium]|nr:glycosyltransferase [Flavobacteriaceae bacterium]MDC1492908.1 glycosyltransferase [Flavobacteriaceae bacterium]